MSSVASSDLISTGLLPNFRVSRITGNLPYRSSLGLNPNLAFFYQALTSLSRWQESRVSARFSPSSLREWGAGLYVNTKTTSQPLPSL